MQIGDRVTCIDPNCGWCNQEGKIIAIDENWIYVEFDNEWLFGIFKEEQLCAAIV